MNDPVPTKGEVLFRLMQMGWKYLSPEEAVKLSAGKRKKATLETLPLESLAQNLLSPIDWERKNKNAFQYTRDFKIENPIDGQEITVDIVLLVNRIPLAAIELLPFYKDEGRRSSQLFLYPPLMVSLSPPHPLYGTAETSPPLWSPWREQSPDSALLKVFKKPLPPKSLKALSQKNTNPPSILRDQEEITDSHRILYGLCHPLRLLEFFDRFLLFDKRERKAARYEQIMMVEEILGRALSSSKKPGKGGGVVELDEETDLSLIMVLAAKSLLLHPKSKEEKIVFVIDKFTEMSPLWTTFRLRSLGVDQAKTGHRLKEMLHEGPSRVIITTMAKLKAARLESEQNAPSLFIFIDGDGLHQNSLPPLPEKGALREAGLLYFTTLPLNNPLKKELYRRFGPPYENPVRTYEANRTPSPRPLYENADEVDGAPTPVGSPSPPYPSSTNSLEKELAHRIKGRIKKYQTRDWTANADALNAVRREADDILYELLDKERIPLSEEEHEAVVERMIDALIKEKSNWETASNNPQTYTS